MTVFLDLADVLALASRLLGDPPPIRDVGLLESAVARPRTVVFGVEASNDDVYEFVLSVASGSPEFDEIAERLQDLINR
ncbi:MAG: hypothetical protein NTU96_01640 [Actinobacteria bacterium]|nr:hypothetical protein [Actinomycetota bacterium]